MKNKTEKIEPGNIEPENIQAVQDKFICIPVACRDAEMIPHTGVSEMNDYFANGWKFLYEKTFGVNERFFYFERIDLTGPAK
jgi:hypothetical protein